MAKTVFLTGAGGFVGSALRRRLDGESWRVRGLARSAKADLGGAERVVGDLLSPETYRAALEGVDVVVHLAAMTGKAAPADYQRANVEGTRALLDACREAGVGRILYVSTIAAGYPDRRDYPYAQTKLAAEALVRASGLAFTIVRPTVVLGGDSPIWATLGRIARLPVIPLPQGARPVNVQPVDVRDVARGLEIILEEQRFEGETLDLGGADPESMAGFLRAVRKATVGTPARVIPVPLAPIRFLLAQAEPFVRPLLPVTAGQLALFANDSVATPNWLMERLRPRMPTLEALLRDLAGPGEPPAPPAAPGPDDIARLQREAHLFARYLTGAEASPDAVRHYVAGARAHGLASDGALSSFDRTCLALARRGPWNTRCVDAVCGLLRRRGALRRKLIIFTAVVENQSPTNEVFEAPQSPGPLGAFFQLAGTGLSFAVAFVLGAVSLLAARVTRLERA